MSKNRQSATLANNVNTALKENVGAETNDVTQPNTGTETEQHIQGTMENPATQDSGTMPNALIDGVVSPAEQDNLGMGTASINNQPKVVEPQVNVVEPVVEETKELPNALQLQVGSQNKLSQVVDFDKLVDELTATGKTVVYNIAEYMKNMAPGISMGPEQGVKHQVKLYRSLELLFNHASDSDFMKIYPNLLFLFHEHGDSGEKPGVFSMQCVYRFPEYITLAKNEREAFSRWLNVLITTSNPATRPDAAKNLNWSYALAYGLTDDAVTRIQAFYNV